MLRIIEDIETISSVIQNISQKWLNLIYYDAAYVTPPFGPIVATHPPVEHTFVVVVLAAVVLVAGVVTVVVASADKAAATAVTRLELLGAPNVTLIDVPFAESDGP